MNGEPLPESHGGPLRVVAPGVIGARSVKWVERIQIKASESSNFYQTKDYKVLPKEATADTKARFMQVTSAMTHYDMNSCICSPQADEVLTSKQIRVEGYAYGANGKHSCRSCKCMSAG